MFNYGFLFRSVTVMPSFTLPQPFGGVPIKPAYEFQVDRLRSPVLKLGFKIHTHKLSCTLSSVVD